MIGSIIQGLLKSNSYTKGRYNVYYESCRVYKLKALRDFMKSLSSLEKTLYYFSALTSSPTDKAIDYFATREFLKNKGKGSTKVIGGVTSISN